MNPVEAFFSIVAQQRQRLLEIEEYDQDCQWGRAWEQRIGRIVSGAQRRGWTQRDKIRAAYSEQSKLSLPSIHRPTSPMPHRPKRIKGRLALLFSFFDQYAPSEVTAAAAQAYCESRPTIGRAVGGAVIELHAVHRRWLKYQQDDSGYPSEIETQWESARDRLHGMLEVLRDAELDEKPAEEISHIQTVRLSQCAGIVNRSKRTLERLKTKDTAFPTPEVIGEDGKPDEWNWDTIRPYLEGQYNRKLPKRFPTLAR